MPRWLELLRRSNRISPAETEKGVSSPPSKLRKLWRRIKSSMLSCMNSRSAEAAKQRRKEASTKLKERRRGHLASKSPSLETIVEDLEEAEAQEEPEEPRMKERRGSGLASLPPSLEIIVEDLEEAEAQEEPEEPRMKERRRSSLAILPPSLHIID